MLSSQPYFVPLEDSVLSDLIRLSSLLVLLGLLACAPDTKPDAITESLVAADRLQGRVLLPGGPQARGGEVVLEISSGGGERKVWLVADEEGRFTRDLEGELREVTVQVGADVRRRFEGERLAAATRDGVIALGDIDLRDELIIRRVTVRGSSADDDGMIRIGRWVGKPPTGPDGGNVALGSRQFPPTRLGTPVDWRIPRDAEEVYFLTERPSAVGEELEWWGGKQQLFGPFAPTEIPAELALD